MMRFTFITLLCILASCTQNRKVKFYEIYPTDYTLLKEAYLDIPLDMIYKDSILIISEFRSDSLIHFFSLESNEFVRSFAQFGEGPDDFLSPIQIILFDSIMYIHNRWHYSLKSFLIRDKVYLEKVESISDLSTDIDMIYPLYQDLFISSGRFSEGRYLLFDKTGKRIDYVGDYPQFQKDEELIENFPKFMFHQSMFTTNKKNNLLASVTPHVLDILDYSTGKPKLINRVLLSSYKYRPVSYEFTANAIEDANNDIGARRIYSTDNYIYILYIPYSEYTCKQISKSEIWIFDWNGKPIRSHVIPCDIACFCIDDAENIYFIANLPDPNIAKASLNLKN